MGANIQPGGSAFVPLHGFAGAGNSHGSLCLSRCCAIEHIIHIDKFRFFRLDDVRP